MAEVPRKCPCGYQPEDEEDRDQHILAMMHVDDGTHHV